MGRLAVFRPIIDGILEAMAEGSRPEAVCDDLGEVGIVRGCYPFREAVAAIGGRDILELFTEQRFRVNLPVGRAVFVFVVLREAKGFGRIVDEFVLVEIFEQGLKGLPTFLASPRFLVTRSRWAFLFFFVTLLFDFRGGVGRVSLITLRTVFRASALRYSKPPPKAAIW